MSKKQSKATSKNIHINYWWRCGSFKNGIPPKLAEALDESAKERIAEMLKEGYLSGELNDNVAIDIPGHRMPRDGYECSGWWTSKEEDDNQPKPVSTVNVIEERDGVVERMWSWVDDEEGNQAAEDRFRSILKENPDIKERDIASYIEDGCFEEGDYCIYLVHSTGKE